MEKQPKTRDEIERLIVAEMKTFLDCENAFGVVVISTIDQSHAATWTISCFNPGRSDGDACNCALQDIVPRLQRTYDMVSKH